VESNAPVGLSASTSRHPLRSLADRLDKHRLLGQVFAWVPMSDRAFERAVEIQEALARRGEHRSAGVVDLLIAATAERHQLIVLSEDRDFDTVAAVTGSGRTGATTAAASRCSSTTTASVPSDDETGKRLRK
jgi:predicted nucleic acid-binding protein